MTESTTKMVHVDESLQRILESLLEKDVDITARAVARLHPSLKAASSITRSESRRALVAQYRHRQNEYRRWRGRAGKRSGDQNAAALLDRQNRIDQLESMVALLTASHLALLRSLGELGGFAKWAAFYEHFQKGREALRDLGAIPAENQSHPANEVIHERTSQLNMTPMRTSVRPNSTT
jgi:hypothetical protein